MGRLPCLGELLGLVAGVGELIEVELGEGELGLSSRVDFSDFAGHAHSLVEAGGSEPPMALL